LKSRRHDSDGRQIALSVVGHLCNQAWRGEESRGQDAERVSVWRCLGDGVEPDRPDGAGPIFDHNLLSHRSCQALTDKARD
jgi:hypothetical protein